MTLRTALTAGVVALAVVLSGCTVSTGVDSASLRERADLLVADLEDVADVLDVDALGIKPGENSVHIQAWLDHAADEHEIADAVMAVRSVMADSDFERFRLEVTIDDPLPVTESATIEWVGLPSEAAMRDEVAVWFLLMKATPLRALDYYVDYLGDDDFDATVQVMSVAALDGSALSEAEEDAALNAAWAAAGRVDPLFIVHH
jgi:hypothetical protein